MLDQKQGTERFDQKGDKATLSSSLLSQIPVELEGGKRCLSTDKDYCFEVTTSNREE